MSLPKSIVDAGDTYQQECEHHVSLLKELMQQKNIPFKEVLLSYQSKLEYYEMARAKH